MRSGSGTQLMGATPIVMSQCAQSFAGTAPVLERHVLGRFVPNLFAGSSIRRFGAPRVALVAATCAGLSGSAATARIRSQFERGDRHGFA
jgi:hypothetical protein